MVSLSLPWSSLPWTHHCPTGKHKPYHTESGPLLAWEERMEHSLHAEADGKCQFLLLPSILLAPFSREHSSGCNDRSCIWGLQGLTQVKIWFQEDSLSFFLFFPWFFELDSCRDTRWGKQSKPKRETQENKKLHTRETAEGHYKKAALSIITPKYSHMSLILISKPKT